MEHPPTMNSFETPGDDAHLPLMLTDTTKPTRSPPNLGFNAMSGTSDNANLAGATTNDS